MKKHIHLYLIILIIFFTCDYALYGESLVENDSNFISGYYQTINLDDLTPCDCDSKTERTHQLNKGLIPYDVSNHNLHSYKFTLGNTSIPAAKLFKALERDLSVYKVSMKEWESFMLLTTDKFDYQSFEQAAIKVFPIFSKMLPEDFLKIKNTTSYLEYMQKLENDKNLKEEYLKSGKDNINK